MWNKDLKTWITFHMFLHVIWGIGASFPKLLQYPSTYETGIIRPTEGLDTTIRSHLLWNKELKTLDFFSYESVLDLGVFGPFPQKLPKCPSTQKTGITQPSDDLGRRARPHLMWNVELKTMDYFRHVPPHDLGYLGPISPNLPDAQIP